MDPEHTATAIEEFVRAAGGVATDDPGFTRTTHLFDAGYVDSLTAVALTVFIEETLSVALDEQDLFDPDFATIDGIARIVSSRGIADQ